MAFGYNPKDAQKPVWPKGEYPAVILTSEEKTSKAGNPMLVITFEVYNGEKVTQIDDYVVNPTTLYKLKGIAKALGELAAFDAGTFDVAQFHGANLILELDIQEGKDGFDDANKVKKYKSSSDATASAPNATAADPLAKNARRIPAGTTIEESDIPFDAAPTV